MDIYFSSDFHAGHKNLVRGTSAWENKNACRNFDTIEEHDKTLLANINRVVQQDDILYFLGDFAMGGYENVYKFRKRIVCKTIHFVVGNHDNAVRTNKIIQTENGFMNIQNLFTTVDKMITKTINGQNIVLCHYPLRSWENGAKGSWMLSGHSHGTLEDYHRYAIDDKTEYNWGSWG